jgi:hypothetical protein
MQTLTFVPESSPGHMGADLGKEVAGFGSLTRATNQPPMVGVARVVAGRLQERAVTRTLTAILFPFSSRKVTSAFAPISSLPSTVVF